jgi:VWFA-related protein
MMTRIESRAHLLWPLVLFLLASLSAQQTPDQQNTAPAAASAIPYDAPDLTFRSRTDLVLVPVVVCDKRGQHIAGLTKAAFSLQENGKTQELSVFEETQPPATNPIASAPDLGYSNLPFDNAQQLRLTILVLDLLNTNPLQRTDGKEQFMKFLSRGLAQNQPVSLLSLTSKGLQLIYPFTADANQLIAALKKTPLGPERIIANLNAAESTLRQFGEIAQAYAGIPGRKTLIFAGGYVPELISEDVIFDNSVLAEATRRMWKNLIHANISVYPIQLLNWTAYPTARIARAENAQMRLRDFAEATGGNLCIETNDFMPCLAQAVEDSRSYYMLGFVVRPDDRRPGWRNLKVKVAADHVTVRARAGFYFGVAAPPTPQSVHDTEVIALGSSLAYSAVPIYVRVLPPASTPAAAHASAPEMKTTIDFLVTIPLSGIKIDPTRTNALDLEIGAIALTRDTREAGEFLQPVHGNPTPETLQQFGREGLKLHEKLDLPPGFYDVRFMAHDNNADQIGTVVFPLEVK